MVNVNLVCVGKIKEKYIENGMAEFVKRMKPYAKLSLIELKEDGNDKNRESSIEKESDEIIRVIEKHRGYTILMDVNGRKFSSEGMAEKIENLTVTGTSTLNFIIGGSYGVSDKLKNVVDLKMSFSDLTFPHQLMRLIFLEQLYRWFSILNNGKYHK